MQLSAPLFRACLAFSLIAVSAAALAQEVPNFVKESVAKADAKIAEIVAIPSAQRTFANTVKAIDDATDQVQTDCSLFVFMQNVSPDAKVREDARAADEFTTNWAIGLGKREDIYKALKEFADSAPKLDPLQQRLLDYSLRDYRRSGMGLPEEARNKLKSIEEQVAKLQIEFNQNVAEDPTTLLFGEKDLAGVPAAKKSAWSKSGDLYLIPLGESSYSAIATYATNEDVRHKAWLAWQRRGGTKNVEILEKIIKLRNEQAKLLGFASTAAYETEIRMAKTPENVAKFYRDLQPIVRKKALVDFNQFQTLKRKLTKNPKAKLMPWDASFYQSKLAKEMYAVDSDKVSEYFPIPSVIKGLFSITQSLYGISFREVTAQGDQNGKPLWDPDVKYFEVNDNATGKTIAHFYLDMYPRQAKYSHAACWGLVTRKVREDGTVQLPIAALVCNVTRGTKDQPGLLPHDEVETLFHEFGHVLHNVLTESPYARFSGTGVELDFVEAPSQMFENWIWNAGVLNTFAKHYKTGKPMPKAMLDGLIAAKNLGSGTFTEGQIFLGNTDQRYYSTKDGVVDTTKVGLQTRTDTTLFPGQPGTMFQAAFGHLMHYQAGYYSYLWSLVFAQDMFGRFEKMGLLNPAAGKFYRENVLSKGGTIDANVMLRNYLGREPKQDAFLRYLGLQR